MVGKKPKVFLTEKEILKLHRYRPQNEVEAYTKKIFLVSAFTGASIEDAMVMSLDNLDMESNTLTYVNSATKQVCYVPVHKKLKPYLYTQYDDIRPSLTEMNRTIRVICHSIHIKQGINTTGRKLVSKFSIIDMRAARRSFATNLYLRYLNPKVIAKLLGVTSKLCSNLICNLGYRNDIPAKFFR